MMGPITKEQSDRLARNATIERYATLAFLVWLFTHNTGAVILAVLGWAWIADWLTLFGIHERFKRFVNRILPT